MKKNSKATTSKKQSKKVEKPVDVQQEVTTVVETQQEEQPVNEPTAQLNESLVVDMELSKIVFSDYNPRKSFSETELNELANSIKQIGVLQPITLRPKGDVYEVVCGERRTRATLLAGLLTIPAIVRNLADDDAREIAITENLQRQDLTPIEEAKAYKELIESGKYDAQSLAVRIGKSSVHIYNRMKLNNLIDDFMQLMHKDEMNIQIAIALSKYDESMQKTIYDEHFSPDVLSYHVWNGLKLNELTSRIEKQYTTNLNQYKFDKGECLLCPFNTRNFELFADENKEQRCTKSDCLKKKVIEGMIDEIRELRETYPQAVIIEPLYQPTNNTVKAEIFEMGYEILHCDFDLLPDYPEAVSPEDFDEKEDFEEAQNDYNEELQRYDEEMREIKEGIENGISQYCIVISMNEVFLAYCLIENVEEAKEELESDTEEEPVAEEIENANNSENHIPVVNFEKKRKEVTKKIEREIKSFKDDLEKKDNRNKEIAIENTIDDTKGIITDCDYKNKPFADIENEMFYYFMFDSVFPSYLPLFGIKDDKHYVTADEKMKAVANLNEEQKTVIKRCYIQKHLDRSYRTNESYKYLFDFARLHNGDKFNAIEKKYNEVYAKRKIKLNESLDIFEFQKNKEKEALLEDIEKEEIEHNESVMKLEKANYEISKEESKEESVEEPEENTHALVV